MPLSFHFTLYSLLPLLTSFLFLLTFKWLSKPRRNRPPSPPKLPIIGNLHQLGSNPHRSLLAMARKHGPLMMIHLGRVPVLVASSANTAKEILKTHDLVFCSRPKQSIPHRLFYGSQDIGFAPYGEHWRQVRSLAVVHLLSNKRVQSFRRVREEETALMIDTICKSCGSVVNLSESFVSLTNNVVCRVAFGRAFRDRKFKDLLGRFLDLLGVFSVETYVPWLAMVDRWRGLVDRTDEVGKELDEFLEGVIEEHLSKLRHGDAGDHGGGGGGGGDGTDENQDLVDVLLEVQRQQATGLTMHKDTIKAVILDIFAAGTDTTSTSIDWGISELIRHPQVMKKLQQEAMEIAQGRPMITEDDLEKMQYLKAFLKETMRFHIPLPLLLHRESIEDVKVMGYDVAAGTQVIVNAWAIGRDPLVWDEPEKFKPERFLNNNIDYNGFHFGLLPFGAGRRGCPGIQFAVAVQELALANMVYKFDLVLPGEGIGEELDMSETFGLTLHRKSPVKMMVTPRF